MINFNSTNRIAAACIAAAVLAPDCSFAAQEAKFIWAGDTQVFCKTGAYFADTAAFMRKWMQVRDTQFDNGVVPTVAPPGPFGVIESAWEYGADGRCRWTYSVPEGCTATVVLPGE